jgi:PBP/GOBP family
MGKKYFFFINFYGVLRKFPADFMKELNDTGSFPDESEKTPMCFIKCIIEELGILKNENDIDKTKAIEAYSINNDELIDECVIEMSEHSL